MRKLFILSHCQNGLSHHAQYKTKFEMVCKKSVKNVLRITLLQKKAKKKEILDDKLYKSAQIFYMNKCGLRINHMFSQSLSKTEVPVTL